MLCLAGPSVVLPEQAAGQVVTDEEVAGTVLAELEVLEPKVDTSEVEDARWFHASWLARQLSSRGPPPSTVLSSCALMEITRFVL